MIAAAKHVNASCRLLVASILGLAAVAKILDATAGTTASTLPLESRWIYALVAIVELALAVLLLRPRSGRMAASVISWGFLGAGLATAAHVMLRDAVGPCRCLGAVQMDRSTALFVQGGIVALSGLILLSSSPTGETAEARTGAC